MKEWLELQLHEANSAQALSQVLRQIDYELELSSELPSSCYIKAI